MMRKLIFAFSGCFLLALLTCGYAQDRNVLIDQWLWPDYTLGQQARNPKAYQLQWDSLPVALLSPTGPHYRLLGASPTDGMTLALPSEHRSMDAFTVEMWLIDHVNQPVGATAYMRSGQSGTGLSWVLGYHDNRVWFSLQPEELLQDGGERHGAVEHVLDGEGWKDRWWHVVGTYQAGRLSLYINGELVDERELETDRPLLSGEPLELAGYFEKEPYMQLGDLMKNVRLLDGALRQPEIGTRFNRLRDMVTSGRLLPDRFHFNAGPYLNNVKEESIQLVWETDRSARSVVRYGDRLPLADSLVFQREAGEPHEDGTRSYIRKATIDGLRPGTAYFYEIEATDTADATIRSGTSTFATARSDVQAYAFAVIGDTEGRPHINNRIAKLAWDERPDFALHLGDVTDGGMKDNKYEWNYEYFAGMGQLLERIPFFPVPGNGEDDLYWYNRYHALPSTTGYYRFAQGDAEFFMLDTNHPRDLQPGGKQYQWLEDALKTSTARWKFVAHHHAIYSADDDDYGNSWLGPAALGDTELQQLAPLYERYQVDVVFYGHLHTYQRTRPIREGHIEPGGVTYIQAGGAGGNLEDFTPTRAWYSAKTYRGHHYCMVQLVGDTLTLHVYDIVGNLRDYLSLQKKK
ncbi:metallophosphoesterase [Parapedobacter pyrenivorans]|nr:metallophosphoesterase [Parapedobacter pyrenivorans]